MIQLLARRRKPRLLDIGCGNGRFGLECAQAIGASEFLGIDSDATVILDAMKSLPARDTRFRFEVGDFTALPIQSERFDAAVSQDAIYLAKDAKAALKQARSALRTDGQFTMTAYVAANVAEGGVANRDEAFWVRKLKACRFSQIEIEDLSEEWRRVAHELHTFRLNLCSGSTTRDQDIFKIAQISRRMLGLDGRKGFLESVRRIRLTAISH